jgi:predicted alpha/beta-fold hydrolase
MSRELPFRPLPLFDCPHRQTIGAAMWAFHREPISITCIVQLSDGDKLALEITTPKNWKDGDLTVLLVHGLCGSHRSPNLVRLASRLESHGIRSVRFNMRGCGTGTGLAKGIFHGGRTEDLFEAIKYTKRLNPHSPMVLIGFSLGGQISLKLAGELNSLGSSFLKGVIAVSPPVDLRSSTQMLGKRENRIYESCFTKLLTKQIKDRYKLYKDMPRIDFPKRFKMYEFDHFFTAPSSGFKSANDYYNKCSSAHMVEDIDIPCKILLSEDDPIVSHSSLDHYSLPSNIEVFKTKKGGHMGYLGHPKGERGFRWLDSLLEDWIREFNA